MLFVLDLENSLPPQIVLFLKTFETFYSFLRWEVLLQLNFQDKLYNSFDGYIRVWQVAKCLDVHKHTFLFLYFLEDNDKYIDDFSRNQADI